LEGLLKDTSDKTAERQEPLEHAGRMSGAQLKTDLEFRDDI
jgi:hypothetical protein